MPERRRKRSGKCRPIVAKAGYYQQKIDPSNFVPDFDRGNFDAVAALVPPDFVFGELKERYGAELDSPEHRHSEEVPLARRIAHQFAVIYVGLEKEKQKGANKGQI